MAKVASYPDYAVDKDRCRDFLAEFKSNVDMGHKYLKQLQLIADRKSKSLEIDLDDLANYGDSEEHQTFVKNVQRNTRRYLSLFAEATDEMLPEPTTPLSRHEDVLDVLISQRLQQQHHKAEIEDGINTDPRKLFPAALLRRYEVILRRGSDKNKILPIRAVRAEHVGSLVSIKGIVIRATEVKPIIKVATYTCDKCGSENYQEVVARQFTPLDRCQSRMCLENNSMGKLYLQTRGSKFEKYQELKIQELADEVPVGNIPRSVSIHCFGEATRLARPGDLVIVSGIFLVTPVTTYRGRDMGGLITDPYLEALTVTQMKRQYDQHVLSEELAQRIQELAQNSDVYNRLSQSIAPEIYGLEDVKKALLLLLVGAPTRVMRDGMRIRGDINMCLMGDPGVAKSQLLKHISHIAPRGVYTTGKGSSGVGLTAALVRDPITDELVLEGGALVLADRGVCCIDEFDKMEEGDRTAIHEVMEQQTISISKAGMTTSLNARTSILAAANPIYGRYNPKLTAAQNINLPPALLSRFDLLFLLLDIPNIENDLKLAAHVTFVHAMNTHPELGFQPLDANLMRHYIAQARQFEPSIPEELTNYITEIYLGMRAQQVQKPRYERLLKKTDGATYITARSLLGILRLSQALARLRFSNEVSRADIDEAVRLVDMSKASLFIDEKTLDSDEDTSSRIYRIIRDFFDARINGSHANAEEDDTTQDSNSLMSTLSYAAIRERVLQKGFKETELQHCLREYEDANVWILTADKSHVRFVQTH